MNCHVNRLLILLILLSVLLSGSGAYVQPTDGYAQRAEGDISCLRSFYLPFVTKDVQTPRIELGTAVAACFMWDERYNITLAENFDRVTPEVEGGYWYVYGLDKGWQPMDTIMEVAAQNDQEVFYHTLRWWWEDQPPDIRAWITEAMTRYPTIYDWVVVNEGWIRDGTPTIPLIDESFIIAREICPGCRLWYNGVLNNVAEQEQAKRLVLLGLADAVGFQFHHSQLTDMQVYRPMLSWLQDNNVPWAITELDVLIPDTSEYYLTWQAWMYWQTVQYVREYNGEFITMWGVSDAVSWKYDYYPLPFGRDYLPKPAWWMLVER